MELYKKLLLRIYLVFTNEYRKYVIYSRFLGVKFGKNVRILHYPRWGSEPFLIEIGNNVTITRGVCFVNHDGGVALFRNEIPNLNRFGKIIVGNNVFIGINSIILPGVTIGDNVIIGAGSVVNRDVPSNSVVAGVPVKVIKNIEDYKIKAITSGHIIQALNSKDRKDEIISIFNEK